MNIANLNASKSNAHTNRTAACLTAALLITLGTAFGAGAQTACLTAVDSPETEATLCAAQLASQTSGSNQINRSQTPDGIFGATQGGQLQAEQIERGETPDGIVAGNRLQAQTFIPVPGASADASLELHTAGVATESGYRVEVRIVSVSLPAKAEAAVTAVVETVAAQYEGFRALESVAASAAGFAFALRFDQRVAVYELEAELAHALSAFVGGEVLVP